MLETLEMWAHLFTGLLHIVRGVSLAQFHHQSEPALKGFITNEHLVVRASSLPQDTHHLERLPQRLLSLLGTFYFPRRAATFHTTTSDMCMSVVSPKG